VEDNGGPSTLERIIHDADKPRIPRMVEGKARPNVCQFCTIIIIIVIMIILLIIIAADSEG